MSCGREENCLVLRAHGGSGVPSPQGGLLSQAPTQECRQSALWLAEGQTFSPGGNPSNARRAREWDRLQRNLGRHRAHHRTACKRGRVSPSHPGAPGHPQSLRSGAVARTCATASPENLLSPPCPTVLRQGNEVPHQHARGGGKAQVSPGRGRFSSAWRGGDS